MSQDRSRVPSDGPAPPAFIDGRRRGLLQGAAVALAGASGAAQAADPSPETGAGAPPVAAPASGYRLTDHVREYYAKARF